MNAAQHDSTNDPATTDEPGEGIPQVPAVPLAPGGPTVSRIAAGCWRVMDYGFDDAALAAWIDDWLSVGVTTFDHADIYGDHQVVAAFGRALKQRPGLRDDIQIVSKCDIRLPGARRPEIGIVHYDSSPEVIRTSVHSQLRALGTDRIDVLLLHRPDPLMDADDTAANLLEILGDGDVGAVGVSNFNVTQFELLADRMPLVTNQVEHSLLHLDPLIDGTLDTCQRHRVRPMYWSPLGGGGLFAREDATAIRVRNELGRLSGELGVAPATLALAWLLREPAGGVPVVGTSRPVAMAEAANACAIDLDRQDWYALLRAAVGQDVP